MGYFWFVVIGVIVVLLLIFFKRYGASNRRDKTAWNKDERSAIEVLKGRLERGDITQEEYDDKIKEIEKDS